MGCTASITSSKTRYQRSWWGIVGIGLLLASPNWSLAEAESVAPGNAVDGWRNATVRPVKPADDASKDGQANRHTIHSYYLTNPESPDGKFVLYFVSKEANGEKGDICVLERATGQERVLVRDVTTEDAHRVACQQWTRDGNAVAFHEFKDGVWQVCVVDIADGKVRTLARDRQLAFGSPTGEWLPIYGCHWNPGEHRDLELVNAATGEIKTVATAKQLKEQYGPWIEKTFEGKEVSIFFPVVSPDQSRIFFKVAAGNGGDNFRSSKASVRRGLVVYDRDSERFAYFNQRWGHPGWHPDSRQIIDIGPVVYDTESGKGKRIADQPSMPGSHPSIMPDGRHYITDGEMKSFPGDNPKEWGVIVGSLDQPETPPALVHRFVNSQGARTWRHNHPHPISNADGTRIYFNVNSGPWTQLYVAEKAASPVDAGKP